MGIIKELGGKQMRNYERIADKEGRKFEVCINSSGEVALSLIIYLES